MPRESQQTSNIQPTNAQVPPGQKSPLAKIPYFANLGQKTLQDVTRRALKLTAERGEIIFLEGAHCEGLYVLQSGRIRIFKTSPQGREQVLALLNPGESFNEAPVFDSGPNPASADALEKCEILLLKKSDVMALLREEPEFATAVVAVFAARLRQLAGLIEDLSFLNVTGRLAKVLLAHADSPNPTRLTQRELATLVGTAREVVSRTLKGLEASEVISVERTGVVVRDRERLEILAGER